MMTSPVRLRSLPTYNYMKYFLFVFIICLPGCKDNNKSAETSNVTEINADWLLGNWERINEQEGIRTFENWSKSTNKGYEGIGWTMQDGDTIFKEILRLVQKDNEWNLEVSEVNDQPTPFRVTNFNDESFVSENEENEFPKKIEYRREGEQLVATISSPGREIDFIFEKVN